MGNICPELFSSLETPENDTKPFSWDLRRQVDPAEYTIEQLENAEAGRCPGQISGQQFIVQNCTGSSIYLLDHINTVTVDDCTDCLLVIGPVRGSVFLRDCKRCRVVVACGQFRTRDCQSMDTLLHCATQPIIEASTGMRFACYQLDYSHLQEHLTAAGLSAFNSSWSCVHDFTPLDQEDESNWSVLSPDAVSYSAFRPPDGDALQQYDVRVEADCGPVPMTKGRLCGHGESVLVLFLPDLKRDQIIADFHRELISIQSDVVMWFCRETQLTSHQLLALTGEKVLDKRCVQGLVVGVQYCSSYSLLSQCQQVCQQVSGGVPQGSVIVTAGRHAANSFYRCCQAGISA